MDAKEYAVAVPPTKKNVAMIPTQVVGTCYFHAAMNAMLNQTQFANAFLEHINARVKKSSFSRRAQESDEVVKHRRGGLDMTVRKQPPALDNTRMMRNVYDVASENPELYEWTRNVIVYNVVKEALELQDAANWSIRTGKVVKDSIAGIMLKEWNSLHKYSDKYEAALAAVEGGFSSEALYSLLSMSGLECAREFGKSRTPWMDQFVARIPSSGWTIVCASPGNSSSLGCPSQVPDDGSYSGIYNQWYAGADGHAMSYTRKPGSEAFIMDSHGTVSSVGDHVNKDIRNAKRMQSFSFYPFYTFQTPQWPLPTKPEASRTDNASSRETDVFLLQAAVIAPNSSDSDKLTIAESDNLATALGVLSGVMLADDESPQSGGRSGPPGAAWAALTTMVMGISFLGSLKG